MRILGVSEGSHDAAWTLIEDGNILEAHHVERHTQIKNDKWIPKNLLPDSDIIIAHEKKNRVDFRRTIAGQPNRKRNIDAHIEYGHYETHAWAGWATSTFEDCDILCIDAIGEVESAACYEMRNGVMRKTWMLSYPESIGLAYSAVTSALGYKPMEEEYIVMGLAAFGEPTIDFGYLMDTNCHRGITLPSGKPEDIAASIQAFYEKQLLSIVDKYCRHDNLILMGGCALNCVANSKIKGKNIWIMPNPGDAGSSLGAAARHYKKKLNWQGPYLGTSIEREVNPSEVARYIARNNMCGVANGPAEFGPRALGNRSLVADPRRDIKDTVNEVKKRQKFRPFGPAILDEFYDEYYDGPASEYMQFVSKAKHDMASVIHIDGTSRVQRVTNNCNSVLRLILEEWYELTGCPMLLNTSLNIKGMPMVDNLTDAVKFERMYGVRVF